MRRTNSSIPDSHKLARFHHHRTKDREIELSHIVMLLALAVGADRSFDDTVRKDLGFLEGEWAMIAGQRDGKVPPGFIIRGARRTAVGNESTVIMRGQVYMKSRYSLDPSQNPKSIDYDVLEGELRSQKQQGIYAIEGNTVKFCFAAPGQVRPTDFTADAGSGRSFSAWQKIGGASTTAVDQPPSGTTYPVAASPPIGIRSSMRFKRFGNNTGSCCCKKRLFGRLFSR